MPKAIIITIQMEKHKHKQQSEEASEGDQKKAPECLFQAELNSLNQKPTAQIRKFISRLDFGKQVFVRYKTKKDSYTPVIALGLRKFQPFRLQIRFDIRIEPSELKMHDRILQYSQEYKRLEAAEIWEERPNEGEQEYPDSKFVPRFFSLAIEPSKKNIKYLAIKTLNDTTTLDIMERLEEFSELVEISIHIPKDVNRLIVAFSKLKLQLIRKIRLGMATSTVYKNQNAIQVIRALSRFKTLQILDYCYEVRGKEQEFIDAVNTLQNLEWLQIEEKQFAITGAQAWQLYHKNLYLVELCVGSNTITGVPDSEARKVIGLLEQRKINYNRFMHILTKAEYWPVMRALRKEHVLNMCEFIKFIVI